MIGSLNCCDAAYFAVDQRIKFLIIQGQAIYFYLEINCFKSGLAFFKVRPSPASPAKSWLAFF